ncbi:MAG: adenylosuccinate synthase [Victivallales bacterium]|nr:adenylosuccinate synthase [Victivallales bacterium]
MPTIVVIGTQWGDEGKGKIVDYLAEQADAVCRYQGGNNAGHTVIAAGKVHKLHLLPSGILYPGCICVIGNDVVVDPAVLLQEMAEMKAQGGEVSGLRISSRAHVIMPYHRLLDKLIEQSKGDKKVGTTGRGIGPCYEDKIRRVGIRFASLMDPESFAEDLRLNLRMKNEVLTKVYGESPLDFDQIYNEYLGYAEQLRPYVTETSRLVNQMVRDGKKVLFEGAQATMLDIDFGTYPYVTSSHPIAAGACIGTGIGPHSIGKVVGVAKAYSTRVGEGPFPTELRDATGDAIREAGHEYGVTTGRPRRCGWLDAVVLRYAVEVSGVDCFALTRVDILDQMPTLKICTAYRIDGKVVTDYPANLRDLAKAEPIYEEMPGWQCKTFGLTHYEDLPENCRRYVERIEAITGCRAGIVSVGPDRHQTIVRESMF